MVWGRSPKDVWALEGYEGYALNDLVVTKVAWLTSGPARAKFTKFTTNTARRGSRARDALGERGDIQNVKERLPAAYRKARFVGKR